MPGKAGGFDRRVPKSADLPVPGQKPPAAAWNFEYWSRRRPREYCSGRTLRACSVESGWFGIASNNGQLPLGYPCYQCLALA